MQQQEAKAGQLLSDFTNLSTDMNILTDYNYLKNLKNQKHKDYHCLLKNK
jgi:hypothetical protein